MNIKELKKIKIAVLAQPQIGEIKRFKVLDFPAIDKINYELRTIKPTDEHAQTRTMQIWSFILSGKWQPDTNKEIESDEQQLTISGVCRADENPENYWSMVALAVQMGDGLICAKPNAIYYKRAKNTTERDEEQADAVPEEWEKIVSCYANDILPALE